MKLSISDLEKIICNIFLHIGCSEEDAKTVSEVLGLAEKRGIPSHGVMRIKDYLGLWKKGRININPNLFVVYETPVTAVIDGDNGLGMIVAKYAMQKTIEKATKNYTGWTSVRNSNHFGIAGYYSMLAMERDMIGISMTNANPLVAPTFSIDRLLGTNPVAVAIPTDQQPPFVADFATTPIARGKLELLEKANKQIAELLVQNKEGEISTEPSILKEGGAILPLGGDYEHGSHKGYCMSAIVDIFSAILSGANFGPFVPPQVAYLEPNPKSPGKGLGHFFGAMRIDAFMPADDFKKSMDLWISTFRNAKTIKGIENIIIPGDPERIKENIATKEGIDLNENVVQELDNTLKQFSIPSPF